jgi:hypothetical protein
MRRCGPGEPALPVPATAGAVRRCWTEEQAGRSCPCRAAAPGAERRGWPAPAPPTAEGLVPPQAPARGRPGAVPPGRGWGQAAAAPGPRWGRRPARRQPAGRSSAGRSGGWDRNDRSTARSTPPGEVRRGAQARSSRLRQGRPRPPAASARSPTSLLDNGSSSVLLGGSCSTGSAARLTSRRGLLLKSTQEVPCGASDRPRFSMPLLDWTTSSIGRARQGAQGKRAGARNRRGGRQAPAPRRFRRSYAIMRTRPWTARRPGPTPPRPAGGDNPPPPRRGCRTAARSRRWPPP